MHEDLGWIKKVDGCIKLADGSSLPHNAVKSTRDVVEARFSKPGIIPTAKLAEKPGILQTNANAKSYVQSSLAQDETGDLSSIMALIQKLGTAQVQRMLTNPAYLEDQAEREEWEQNFD